MRVLFAFIIVLCDFLPVVALAGTVTAANSGGTPEIPAGAAPIVVAGIAGTVLWVRNRAKGKKKD